MPENIKNNILPYYDFDEKIEMLHIHEFKRSNLI